VPHECEEAGIARCFSQSLNSLKLSLVTFNPNFKKGFGPQLRLAVPMPHCISKLPAIVGVYECFFDVTMMPGVRSTCSSSISMSSIEIDEQEAEHALCLNNDHKEGTEDAAAHQHCVLLEELNE
jgi:hypothetical protein